MAKRDDEKLNPKAKRPPKPVNVGRVEKPGEFRLDDPREALREALTRD